MASLLSDQAGTVLVLVLWVLAMLTVIGGYYAVEARIRRNVGQSAWNELQGQEAVYSILRLAALKLAPPGASRDQDKEDASLEGDIRIYADGVPCTVKFGGQELQFVLQDESGKLSLNKASEQQLEKLFGALLGEDDQRVLELTESILDWRDADNIVRDDGAEDDFYAQRQPPYQAADRPFLLIDELLLVRDVDMDLFYGPLSWVSEEDAEAGADQEEEVQPTWTGGLRDLLSVYNDTSGINMQYAPAPLKELFQGSTGAGSTAGKTLCLQMKWQGIGYAVYWSRLSADRFGIVHWTEQGYQPPEIKKQSQ